MTGELGFSSMKKTAENPISPVMKHKQLLKHRSLHREDFLDAFGIIEEVEQKQVQGKNGGIGKKKKIGTSKSMTREMIKEKLKAQAEYLEDTEIEEMIGLLKKEKKGKKTFLSCSEMPNKMRSMSEFKMINLTNSVMPRSSKIKRKYRNSSKKSSNKINKILQNRNNSLPTLQKLAEKTKSSRFDISKIRKRAKRRENRFKGKNLKYEYLQTGEQLASQTFAIIKSMIRMKRTARLERMIKNNPEYLKLKDQNGRGVLHWAFFYKNKDFVKFLVKSGGFCGNDRFGNGPGDMLKTQDFGYLFDDCGLNNLRHLCKNKRK
jgi:hypothetical protein